jgi:soluble lytic murein transglycosylase-like protein
MIMNRIQSLLFPGMIIGILVVVWFSTVGAATISVEAKAPENTSNPETPAAGDLEQKTLEVQSSTQDAYSGEGECSISTKYPDSIRQWCSLIEKYGHESGLDPEIIAAVMLQESGGDATAYSHSGAVGLLQVMPRDGIAAKFQCANGPCFTNRPSIAELEDPDFNIAYGTRMLAGLATKKGSLREALRSYGPMDMGYAYADIVLTIYKNYK